MRVVLANSESDRQRWDDFVEHHPESSNYHRWGWKTVIENSFGWPTFYLMAEEGDQVGGVLPLAWQKSMLFGSFMTSLPFFNYGGVLANSPEVEQSLVQEAVRLAQERGVTHMELRHRRDHALGLPQKTHKVTVVSDLAPEKKMWDALDTKVRNRIRRAMKYGLSAEVHGAEALDDFYQVFANNMRDLGTPVYGRGFFQQMLQTFPKQTHITVVRLDGRPVACSFLVGYRGSLEAGWSSSLREVLHMKPNMLLYWKNQVFGAEHGYSQFDFGRSSIGSGTHEFKKQWNSRDLPLFWTYWLRGGKELPELNPDNPKYKFVIHVWQRLPLSLTKWVGPKIVRCLP